MIKKQITAVEWLVMEVNSDCTNSAFIRPELVAKAKQMENQRLNDAFTLGLECGTERASNNIHLEAK